MFAIFKLVLSICSILMIGLYYFILSRKKEYSKNIYFKRRGILCSKCTSVIDIQKDNYDIDMSDKLTECLACRRESRLNFSSIKDKFDRWVLTKKSENILILCIFIPFPFTIASLFIGSKTFSDITSITNSSVLITYWLIMIYRIYLCRNPLPDSL